MGLRMQEVDKVTNHDDTLGKFDKIWDIKEIFWR